ncbi:MAG: hypothetical protein IJ593_11755, partial [Lachnospiraceae bacterium]|nr:hypothetical protein [Lachnospiraceae bacterium]
EDGIELYEITEFGFYIEYKHDSRNLFNAIQSAVNALGFRQDKVNVYMINHHVDKSLSIENDTDDEEVVKSKKKKSRTRKSDKSSDKSSEIKLTKFEDIEELGDFRLTLNKVNIEHTETKKLSELCTKDENNVPDKFDIQALIIDGEEMEISNNLVAGAMVLSNLYIYYEDSAYKEFISNTVIDNVGVTKDKHAYLGIMKTMQVYNTDLYFYYNGSNRKLVEYIWNIYESIGVDQSSLKFKYKTN